MWRSHIDFIKYLFKIKRYEAWGFVFDLVFILLTLIKVVYDLSQSGTESVFLSFSKDATWINKLFSFAFLSQVIKILVRIGLLWHKRYKAKEEAESVKLVEKNIDTDLVIPSEKERIHGFDTIKIKNNNEFNFFISSEIINNLLTQDKIETIIINQNGFKQIWTRINNRKNILLPFLTHQYFYSLKEGKNFFNEEKLCLSCDLEKDNPEVICHKGSYFDSFLTNERYGKHLVSKLDSSDVIADARNYAPFTPKGGKWVISDITSSYLNHHIGISTIALTKDKYMVFWKQNDKNQIRAGKIVSTGSGSCDYADLVKVENENYSFPLTIKKAMERELREENKLGAGVSIQETVIVGYFRWISRGGKPEFVGFSRLNSMMNDLHGNEKEVYERITVYYGSESEIPSKIDDLLANDYSFSESLLFNLHQLKWYFMQKNVDRYPPPS